MTAATATAAPATVIPTGAALLLPCPRCCCHDASLLLHLGKVGTFTCGECEEEFDTADIRAIIDGWAPVLAWLAGVPVSDEETEARS